MDEEQESYHIERIMKMTKYGRSYCPPIFHIADADNEQIKVMESVFYTLANSGVEFVEVRRSDADQNTIDIVMHGFFTHEEKAEILTEIQEVYVTE